MAIQAQSYQDSLVRFPLCGNFHEFFMENGINGCGSSIFGMNFNSQEFLQKQSRCVDATPINVVGDWRLAPAMSQSPSLYPVIDPQGREIDRCLRLQSKRLRLVLHKQRKWQTAEFLRRIESKTQILIAQKEQEIAQASQKTAELQEFVSRLEMESEAWKRLAKETGAMVASLNNTLNELSRDKVCSTSSPSDSESCFVVENREGGRPEEEGTGENAVDVPAAEAEAVMAAACRGCGTGSACILFLPCRHLCLCKPCAAFLNFCPVCETAKKACVEALFL